MKFDELKKKTPEELKKELDAATFEMMRYNAQVATGGAGKDVGKVKELKKKVARIKTLQNSQSKD
jgi:large subunit ribosomal protein L29